MRRAGPGAVVAADYVDLYQAHRYDVETPLEETMQAFADVVRQGKGAPLMETFAGVAARLRGDAHALIATSTAALAHLANALLGPGVLGLRSILSTQRGVGHLWAGETAGARNRTPRHGPETSINQNQG